MRRCTTRHRTGHPIRRLALAGLWLLASACGGSDSGGGPPVAPPPPPEALTAVTVSPAMSTLVVDSSAALTPTATTRGSGVSVVYSYTSSATAVAAVNGSGVVTGVAPGTATITVAATGSGTGFTTSTRQATATVTVTAPPAALTALAIAPDSVTLQTGGSATLTPIATTGGAGVSVQYTYASSAPTIATVSAAGVVTAVSPGTSSITVTATGSGTGFATSERQATAVVMVTAPPPALTALSVSPDSVALLTGGSASLTPTATTAGAGASVQYAYASSASTVATVSASGTVTAVSPGIATITVTATGSGIGFATTERQATATVTVTAPPPAPPALTDFTASPVSLTLAPGGSSTITPNAVVATPSVHVQIDYRSGQPAVATVNATGVVTAVAPGNTIITVEATASGADVTTATRGAVVTVTVLAPTAQLGVGFGAEQFALVPSGSFDRGSTSGTADEQPVRTITITQPFLMQRTEVTQGQWRAVMQGTSRANPSFFAACGDRCPVEQVSWDDIQLFLQRINAQDPGKGYRLPTEAEWEYTARAGTTGDFGVAGAVCTFAAVEECGAAQTRPVAVGAANAWGLHDMHGNALEWVHDWYAATYYGQGPTQDPLGPASGTLRVMRGGAWCCDANSARVWKRGGNSPSVTSWWSGFRLVRDP